MMLINLLIFILKVSFFLPRYRVCHLSIEALAVAGAKCHSLVVALCPAVGSSCYALVAGVCFMLGQFVTSLIKMAGNISGMCRREAACCDKQSLL